MHSSLELQKAIDLKTFSARLRNELTAESDAIQDEDLKRLLTGNKAIEDPNKAQELARMLLVYGDAQVTGSILGSIIESTTALYANSQLRESFAFLDAFQYKCPPDIALLLGRYPVLLRDTKQRASQAGQNRVLNALSQNIPLADLLEKPKEEIISFTTRVSSILSREVYSAPTTVTGINLQLAYKGDQLNWKALHQPQLKAADTRAN